MRFFNQYRWEFSLAVLFVMMLVIMSILSPSFGSFSTILSVSTVFLPIAIMALGVTGVIITGGIDLSIGAVGSLAAVLFSLTWQYTHLLILSILVGFVTGIICGLLNGLIVTSTPIQPLIATLSTMFIFQSLAIVIIGQRNVSSFPNAFVSLGMDGLGNIPYQLIIFVLVAIVLGLLLSRTKFGHEVRLIGNNEGVALYSGIKVRFTKSMTYLISSVIAALAGMLMVAYFSSVKGDIANANLMPAIASVVLGGIDIFGGSGTMVGVVLGSLFMGYLGQGLDFLNVSQSIQPIVSGIILLIAVSLRQARGFSLRKRLSRARIKEVVHDA